MTRPGKSMKRTIQILLFLMLGYASIILFVHFSSNRRNIFLVNFYFKNNLERLNNAIAHYADISSGRMPLASNWADIVTDQEIAVLNKDFISPQAYPSYGIYYNSALEGKLYSDLKGETVVLFTLKGEWNSSASKEYFIEHRNNVKNVYLITIDGDVFKSKLRGKHFVKLRDGRIIQEDDLFWEE